MVVVCVHAQGVYLMLTVSMETAFLITVVSYSTFYAPHPLPHFMTPLLLPFKFCDPLSSSPPPTLSFQLVVNLLF